MCLILNTVWFSEEDNTIHKTIQYTDHDAILHEYEIRFKSILAQQNTCLKSTYFFICFLRLYFKSLRNMKDVKMVIMMMKCTFKCGFRMKFINVSFKLPECIITENNICYKLYCFNWLFQWIVVIF